MTEAVTAARRNRVSVELQESIDRALARALAEDWVGRIWARDASVWTDDDHVAKLISNRLGWLDLPTAFRDRVDVLEAFATGVAQDGFTAAIVCGMGGSSLAPEVLATSLPLGETGMPVRVLDSTDPAAVRAVSAASDPASSMYLIASKSGTTTETLAFLAHFWQLEDDVHADIPSGLAGEHFIAISDSGPSVEAIPHNDLLRELFLNPADVGGRYSALTYVGLVPAAFMALDMRALLDSAAEMAVHCAVTEATNPGLWLGAALGTLARAGRDKLTLIIEPRNASLGGWIEQLVAESTGKHGVGIIPVVGEPLGDPAVYADDRVFVRLSSGSDDEWDQSTGTALDALADAGHPVIELDLASGGGAVGSGTGAGTLGAEFVRWEFATAVAGAVLGINPFDEPNVTESKDNTKRVLQHYRETAQMPAQELLASEGPLRLYGDAPLRLTGANDAGEKSLATELRRHLARSKRHGYIGVQAYVAQTPERDALLRGISELLRDRTTRPVTLGYGPRFLHSTGQLHKGGPPTGCFIQLTADHAEDLPIPGWRETFGTLIQAQAAGDFMSLEAHELPVVSINLSSDPDEGLAALRDVLENALAEPFAMEAR